MAAQHTQAAAALPDRQEVVQEPVQAVLEQAVREAQGAVAQAQVAQRLPAIQTGMTSIKTVYSLFLKCLPPRPESAMLLQTAQPESISIRRQRKTFRIDLAFHKTSPIS